MYKLRDYQQDCVNTVMKDMAVYNRILTVLPCGSGKSLVIASLVQEILKKKADARIVVVVNSLELVIQNAEHIKAMGNDCEIYVGASKGDLSAPIISGAIQSLYKHSNVFYQADYVIVDETDSINVDAVQFGKMLTTMKRDCKLVGLTATPYRLSDGLLTEEPNKIFNKINYEVSITELTKKKWLAPLVYKYGNSSISIDTEELVVKQNRYTEKSITAYLDKHALVPKHAELVKRILDDEIGTCGIVFAGNIQHANELTDALIELEIPAVVVHSKIGTKARKDAIRDFKNGKYKVIVNVDILCVGFDHPQLDFGILARPTKSKRLYVQMVGRIQRLAEGKKEGLVFDLANLADEHGILYEKGFEFKKKIPVEGISDKTLGALKKEEQQRNYINKMNDYKMDNNKLQENFGKGNYIYASEIRTRAVMTKAGVPAIVIEFDSINIKNQEEKTYSCWFNIYNLNEKVCQKSRKEFSKLMELKVCPFETMPEKAILVSDMQYKLNEAANRKLVNRIYRVSYSEYDFKQGFPYLEKIAI